MPNIDLKHIQTEVDASDLYGILATTETDTIVEKVFAEMSDIEKVSLFIMSRSQLFGKTLMSVKTSLSATYSK